MREILFRGQTRKYGEKVRMGDGQKLPGHWVYGGVLQCVGSHSIIYGCENVNDPGENLDKWCVHTDTLCQYTGMKDKNGRRIFEGDICKVGNLIYKVVFEYSCWWFKILSNKVYCCPAFNSHCGEYCEIIGNIHDNPELLENP